VSKAHRRILRVPIPPRATS